MTFAVCADATALPFADASIDVVLCSQLLHHFDEPGAEALSAQEQQHAAIVQSIVASRAARDHSKGEQIATAESWHKGATSGNDLRAAVLGANDGLVSNFCLIMGVAGAGSGNRAILLTGLAGLVAGACSMALGEWLSVTNARELARTQLAREADEIEHTPDAERHELALIYQAKGIDAKRRGVWLRRSCRTAITRSTRSRARNSASIRRNWAAIRGRRRRCRSACSRLARLSPLPRSCGRTARRQSCSRLC